MESVIFNIYFDFQRFDDLLINSLFHALQVGDFQIPAKIVIENLLPKNAINGRYCVGCNIPRK